MGIKREIRCFGAGLESHEFPLAALCGKKGRVEVADVISAMCLVRWQLGQALRLLESPYASRIVAQQHCSFFVAQPIKAFAHDS